MQNPAINPEEMNGRAGINSFFVFFMNSNKRIIPKTPPIAVINEFKIENFRTETVNIKGIAKSPKPISKFPNLTVRRSGNFISFSAMKTMCFV